ncbi:MAG: hypothetical protein HY401_02180 [Elusimicrobia bacterium]|nr:hypothetical protein [Elusimicrobiota bacterium]
MSAARSARIFILGFLLALAGYVTNQKIELTTADLGRHLKNGEIFFNEGIIPQTNFYSYTHPDHPVVNHHWGAGAIFYLVRQAAGFGGLSLFFMAASLAAFLLVFDLAARSSCFEAAAVLSMVTLPLLGSRSEIRPEVLSCLFIAFFLWVLWDLRNFRRWRWVLPVVQAAWVNTHIYFFFGPCLIGLFLLDRLVGRQGNWRQDVKHLGQAIFLCAAAAMINPAGPRGVLYPLLIFRSYEYRLFENQSVSFLERLNINYSPIANFKIALGILAVSWVIWFVKTKRLAAGRIILSLAAGLLAWTAVRNLALFGHLSLPLMAANFGLFFPRAGQDKSRWGESWRFNRLAPACFLAGIFLLTMSRFNPEPFRFAKKGLGLQPGTQNAAGFFVRENIQGPVFNNYDIGGYLIYYLYPGRRVFVDNRPEAYPGSFFKDVYVPMQEHDEAWNQADARYNFNAIFFYRHDLTPWGQNFLIQRIRDPRWAPVFVDEERIVFLRRNGPNRKTIEQFELPREMFSIKRQG